MVEEAVKSYRVAYERDESGWWVATVRGVRGCHTQGRTVDEARRRIREALELFVDDARKAPIVDDVKLPSAATRRLGSAPRPTFSKPKASVASPTPVSAKPARSNGRRPASLRSPTSRLTRTKSAPVQSVKPITAL